VNDGPAGAGGFLRPRFEILGEESLVPDENLIRPAPDRFTHELVRTEPYFYDPPGPAGDVPPDGSLPAGTRVVVLDDRGDRVRVVDGRGLAVEVACDSLRELPRG